MNTLENIQHNFSEALLNPEIASLDFIRSDHAIQRLGVYRATIFENLRNSLALTFPGIWTLLGHDSANSLAYAFIKKPKNMPKTGCLDDWGDDFPNFLSAQPELTHLPYLKDYAQYEWLVHLAYGSAISKTVTTDDLKKIAEEKIEDTRLVFIPSVFLLTTQFPLSHIQNIIANPDAQAINLQKEISTTIIAKPQQQVLTLFVAEDIGLFFKCLYKNQTLGRAATTTSRLYPDFDLSMAIGLLLKHSLIQEVL